MSKRPRTPDNSDSDDDGTVILSPSPKRPKRDEYDSDDSSAHSSVTMILTSDDEDYDDNIKNIETDNYLQMQSKTIQERAEDICLYINRERARILKRFNYVNQEPYDKELYLPAIVAGLEQLYIFFQSIANGTRVVKDSDSGEINRAMQLVNQRLLEYEKRVMEISKEQTIEEHWKKYGYGHPTHMKEFADELTIKLNKLLKF